MIIPPIPARLPSRQTFRAILITRIPVQASIMSPTISATLRLARRSALVKGRHLLLVPAVSRVKPTVAAAPAPIGPAVLAVEAVFICDSVSAHAGPCSVGLKDVKKFCFACVWALGSLLVRCLVREQGRSELFWGESVGLNTCFGYRQIHRPFELAVKCISFVVAVMKHFMKLLDRGSPRCIR